MKENHLKRRRFLKSTTALTAGILFGGAGIKSFGSANTSSQLTIKEPFHGAILNRRQGKEVSAGLKIKVLGEAPLRSQVTVNGITAQRAGTEFVSEVVLRDKKTEIIVIADGWFGQNVQTIQVLWDKYSFPRYRFAIDDNSFFLRDIAQKKYSSIFDCFYLKNLRKLHVEYGTRFVLNIYYATEDGFQLPQFPERYKSEWQDNSDWLKLAFHAYADKPDRPYQYASTEKLIADFDLVSEQIHRFAGEETYSPPTVIHWAMVQPEALKPLAERGVRVLSTDVPKKNGVWDTHYFLDDIRSEYLSRHDSLMDFDSGIIFSKTDLICNLCPIDRIVPTLESVKQDPNRAEIIDLFTHEQYFWPFYFNYIPDHFERLDKTLHWVTENGYKPVFFHEGLLGAPE